MSTYSQHSQVDEKQLDVAERLFQRFDKDRSGYLDFEEVRQLMGSTYTRLNMEQTVQISDEDVRQFLKLADANVDGKLSLEEYKTFVINSLKTNGIAVEEDCEGFGSIRDNFLSMSQKSPQKGGRGGNSLDGSQRSQQSPFKQLNESQYSQPQQLQQSQQQPLQGSQYQSSPNRSQPLQGSQYQSSPNRSQPLQQSQQQQPLQGSLHQSQQQQPLQGSQYQSQQQQPLQGSQYQSQQQQPLQGSQYQQPVQGSQYQQQPVQSSQYQSSPNRSQPLQGSQYQQQPLQGSQYQSQQQQPLQGSQYRSQQQQPLQGSQYQTPQQNSVRSQKSVIEQELDVAEQIFGRFDKDRSGYLDREEIKQLIDATYRDANLSRHAQIGNEDVASFLRLADANSDGRLSLEEYKNFVINCLKKQGFKVEENCEGFGTIRDEFLSQSQRSPRKGGRGGN